MEFDVKYDFSVIYFYNKNISTPHHKICLYCKDGEMKRVGDGKVVKCPVCNGEGKIETGSGSIVEEPRKCYLRRIKINKTNRDEDIEYVFVDNETAIIVNRQIYKTLDDCIDGKTKGCMGYTS